MIKLQIIKTPLGVLIEACESTLLLQSKAEIENRNLLVREITSGVSVSDTINQ